MWLTGWCVELPALRWVRGTRSKIGDGRKANESQRFATAVVSLDPLTAAGFLSRSEFQAVFEGQQSPELQRLPVQPPLQHRERLDGLVERYLGGDPSARTGHSLDEKS